MYHVQEAEIKAKNMEEEMFRLQKSLEERNGQLQASASSSEKVLFLPFHARSLLIAVCYVDPLNLELNCMILSLFWPSLLADPMPLGSYLLGFLSTFNPHLFRQLFLFECWFFLLVGILA